NIRREYPERDPYYERNIRREYPERDPYYERNIRREYPERDPYYERNIREEDGRNYREPQVKTYQNKPIQREYDGTKVERNPRGNINQETKSDEANRSESERKTNFNQSNAFESLENNNKQDEFDRRDNENKQDDENNRFSGLISRIKKDEDDKEY
ncbi:hypothetical protein EB169_12745, partial [archaeon]|nr:hypothetical protein [archaeon]